MQHSKGSFEGLFVHVFLDLPVNLPYSFFCCCVFSCKAGDGTEYPARAKKTFSHWAPFFAPHSISSCGREFQQLCRDRVIPKPSMFRARGPAPPSTELRYEDRALLQGFCVCKEVGGGEPRHPAFLGTRREIKIDVLVSRSLPRPATLWEAGFLCPVPFSSDQHP